MLNVFFFLLCKHISFHWLTLFMPKASAASEVVYLQNFVLFYSSHIAFYHSQILLLVYSQQEQNEGLDLGLCKKSAGDLVGLSFGGFCWKSVRIFWGQQTDCC